MRNPRMPAVLIAVSLSAVTPIQAQSNQLLIASTPPASLAVCQAPVTFGATLENVSAGGISGIQVTVTFPAGVRYTPGSIGGATEQNITNLEQPVFAVPGTLPSGTTVALSYSAAANCGALAQTGSVTNQTRADYGVGFDVETNPVPYDLLAPVLSLTTANIVPSSFSGDIGVTFVRTITVINSGNAPLDGFTLTDAHDVAIQINTVTGGTHVNAGNVETITVTSADMGGPLLPGGSHVVTEEVEILACTLQGEGASTFTVAWGCDNETCDAGNPNASTSANVVVLPGTPVLKFSVPAELGVCWDDHVENVEMTIENVGTGPAHNILIELSKNSPSGFSDFVPGSFTLTDNDGNTVAISPDSVELPAITYLQCLSAGAPDFGFSIAFFTIPRVGVGETWKLGWDAQTCCPPADTCGFQSKSGWQWIQSYENQCTPESRTAELLDRRSGRHAFMVQAYEGPSDLSEGETATFTFLNTTFGSLGGDATQHLRAIFTVGEGLFYEAGSLVLISATGTIWQPASVVISGPNDGSAATVVTGTFTYPPLPAFPSAGFTLELTGSEFHIDLTSVCPAPPVTTVGHQVFWLPSQSCGSECALSILCREESVSTHCPGCRRQGIHALGFSIKRTTLGNADDDPHDGIADNVNTLDLQKIKTNRVMTGDVIEGRLHGLVMITPDFNPYPFPYDFAYGFYESVIENGQLLDVLDAEIELFDASTLLTHTITLPAQDVVVTDLGGGQRKFFYDFSVAQLHGYGVPTTFTKFDHGDVVVFKPRYLVTGNIGAFSGIVPSMVNNLIYLAVVANPACDPLTCLPDMGQVDLCGSPTPVCDDSVFYYCTKFGGIFHLLGYTYRMDNVVLDTSTCEKNVVMRNNFIVGPFNDVTKQFFPFEHRHFGHVTEQTYVVPEEYEFVRARLAANRTGAPGVRIPQGVNDIVPDQVNLTLLNATELVFNIDQYYTDDTAFAFSNGNLLYEGDESLIMNPVITIAPSCQTVPDVRVVPEPSMGTATYNFGDEIVNQFAAGYIFRAPALQTQALLPAVDGVESEVCWQLAVDNVAPDADAANVFLATQSPSGMVNVVRVTDLDANLELQPVNGLYRLDQIDRLQTRNVEVCATYSCTALLDPDTLNVFDGWDCAGYPTSLQDYPCSTGETVLTVQPKQAGMQAILDAPGAAAACASAPFEVLVSSTQAGTIEGLRVAFTVPAGLSFEPGSGSMEYPIGNGFTAIADPLLTASTYEWDIDAIDATIGANGLPGGGLQPLLSQFLVRFNLVSDCGYSPGNLVGFEVSGISNCGDLLTATFDELLGILGFPDFTNLDIALGVNDFDACETGASVNVVLTNTGAIDTGTDETLDLLLPAGLDFVDGSFVGIHNPPPNGVPVQTPIGLDTQLTWALPAGVAPGDTIEFGFDIVRDGTETCGPFTLPATSVINASVNCATGGVCVLEAQTGTGLRVLAVADPAAPFTVPVLVCVNQPFDLAGSSCGDQSWDFGDGTPVESGISVTHTYDDPGSFTITHTVQGDCSSATTTEEVVVEVCNLPPACDAGGPYLVECQGNQGSILLDASLSSDPDGDPLTYLWTTDCPGGTFDDSTGAGPTLLVDGPATCTATCSVDLTVTDPFGESDTCQAAITVEDTTPPQLDVPAPVTLECTDANGVAGTDPRITAWLAEAASSDNCGPVTLVHDAPAAFPGGCAPGVTTTVTFTATDGCGQSVSGSSTVTVVDTTGPVIDVQPLLDPTGCAFLWPPQHGYVDFGLVDTGISAHDACGTTSYEFSSCHSSQPENANGVGDGNSTRDCVYEPAALHLRSERNGTCSPLGRVYSATVDAVDECGNRTTSAPFGVCVWHDRRDPPPAGAVIYAPNPASHQNDTRPGSNGTYGTDCGPGCDAECDPSTAAADPQEADWDGDGVPLGQDNCPDIANSAQLNSDPGPEGDACDANDALIDNLRFRDRGTLTWAAEGGMATYKVYRGSFDAESSFVNATCLDVVGAMAAFDGPAPEQGGGYFYLITGVFEGVEQSAGRASNGAPREISGPCPQ